MLEKYVEKPVPAMPCYGAYTHGEAMITTDGGNQTPRDGHTDKTACLGNMSEDFMAMIHTAKPDGKIRSIPRAKQSVDDEWTKLHTRKAFGMKQAYVKEMYDH